MEPGELKPILAALVLPPTGPLLLALLGVVVALRRRGFGLFLVTLGIAASLLLSTNGFALVLARHLMPPVAATQPQALQSVQAIVILGGGVEAVAPEYGVAQPGEHTLQRLRYGAEKITPELALGWTTRGSARLLGRDDLGHPRDRVVDGGIAMRWFSATVTAVFQIRFSSVPGMSSASRPDTVMRSSREARKRHSR